MGKKIVYSMTPDRSSPTLSNAELAFAGFFSAVPTTLVAAPVERVKVLLQVRTHSRFQCVLLRGFSADTSSTSPSRCKVKVVSSSTLARSTPYANSTAREVCDQSTVEQVPRWRVTDRAVPPTSWRTKPSRSNSLPRAPTRVHSV